MTPDDLKLMRPLKSNQRFESYEAKYKGRRVFAKQARSERTAVHLDFQVRNGEIVNKIGGQLLRAPQTILKTKDWLVAEWIDGQPLEAKVATQPKAVAETLARVIYLFDSQISKDAQLREIFTPAGLRQRVDERIKPEIRKTSPGLFEDSLDLFEKYSAELAPCLQDADVQPEHLLSDPQKPGAYVLVDSEHMADHWPRYFDLANNYTKYWKRDNKSFSVELLKSYLKISSASDAEIFEPFLASVIVRCLALHWEDDHDPGALATNVPRCQELLRLVLSSKGLSHLIYLDY